MPISVAIASTFQIIETGVRSLLSDAPNRVLVVDGLPQDRGEVDVLVSSSFGTSRSLRLPALMESERARRMVVMCWDFEPGMVEHVLAAGASGYLSTALTGPELVAALEDVHDGKVVVSTPPPRREQPTAGALDWPGSAAGLSEREADILALIATGLRNEEIAGRLFLSINTVKSYIRTAYRKIDVDSRTRAVLWAVDHGLQPPDSGQRPERARAR